MTRHTEANEELLIHEIVRLIDPDEPPGLAAHRLARAVVALVRDRDGKTAARIAVCLEELSGDYPR